jgi:CubicO group peptidase (beta-lactamase class C family)
LYTRPLWYNYVDIDDYHLFANRTVKAGTPQPWPVSTKYNQIKLSAALQRELDSIKSVAFVVIKNDSLAFEEYWEGYGSESLSNSFSCAKSIVGILAGIAHDEGKIKSLDDPIGNYIPDLTDPGMKEVTCTQPPHDVKWLEPGMKVIPAFFLKPRKVITVQICTGR